MPVPGSMYPLAEEQVRQLGDREDGPVQVLHAGEHDAQLLTFIV
jgi:hypothetical protein